MMNGEKIANVKMFLEKKKKKRKVSGVVIELEKTN